MRYLLSLLFGLQKALAWGELGHLTVCDLAYRNFTPATRNELVDLFQVKSGGITAGGRHYTAFNVGCLEEDAFPRKHQADHFINVPRATATISSDQCPGLPNGRQGECILAGLRRDLAILKDRSKSRQDRVIALMAVGHWIGDIHQPLHISFADDRGGNNIDVRFSGNCGGRSRPDNLHAVWDNCALQAGLFERVRQRADYKASWGERTITYRAVDSLMSGTSLTREQAFVRGEPWQWAAESYAITLDPSVRYCVMVGASCQYSATAATLAATGAHRKESIDTVYLDSIKDIAQERVRKAGFRLAHLINEALDPAYTGPVADGSQPHS